MRVRHSGAHVYKIKAVAELYLPRAKLPTVTGNCLTLFCPVAPSHTVSFTLEEHSFMTHDVKRYERTGTNL